MISLLLSLAIVQEASANPIQVAAKRFGDCMEAKIPLVPATVTPEAGADDVIKQCDAERAGVEQAVETMIAAAPPEMQASARENLKQGLVRNRTRVIDKITALRAGTAKTGR